MNSMQQLIIPGYIKLCLPKSYDKMENFTSYNHHSIPRENNILVRAGFCPIQEYSPIDFIMRNLVGDNLGNMLFAYGVMNMLWTKNTSIAQIYDKLHYTDEDINVINSNYDAFVMPMADAFRPTFIPQLKSYTSLIQKLKIPVIVIGIGLRTTYEPKFCINTDLDNAVCQFVKSVLDHSSKLGLRGEITGTYLKKLGFKEERDYIPIGCPSLYTYGNNIATKELLDYDRLKQGKLVFNANSRAQYLFGEYIKGINSFILNTIREIPNHYFIQQLTSELKEIYLGKLYTNRVKVASVLPVNEMQKMLKSDKVKCFLDVPSWVNFCKDADLFIGNRFHGAAAAILAGSPHLFLPFDGRTRELSEFHHITSISPYDLKRGKQLIDYLSTLDFYSFEKHLNNTFENYIDFLNSNRLV